MLDLDQPPQKAAAARVLDRDHRFPLGAWQGSAVHSVFAMMDTNNDGYLSKEEVASKQTGRGVFFFLALCV